MSKDNFHRSKEFKDLSFWAGANLIYHRGLDTDNLVTKPDGKVTIIAEYPKTVLVEMEFIHSDFHPHTPSRTLRWLIPKSSLAVGDFLLQDEDSREYLTKGNIAELVYQEPFKINTLEEYMFLL